jgi:O-succinylbenzoate synthase
MKIDRIELRLLNLRLRERFEISSGGRQDRTIFLVTVHGEGATGWGECVAMEDPSYSPETTETAWHLIRDFIAPRLVGAELEGAAAMPGELRGIRGNPMAVAGVEMALWDLEARLAGVSLAEHLGGALRPVPVGVSVGLQPDDHTLIRKVEGYVKEGYRRIKLKIKPGRDVAMLRAVRRAFPQVPLMADANSAYTLADVEHLRGLDPLALMMVEQPLAHDDLLEHARLAEQVETPVCLDESVTSLRAAVLALELGSCSVINLKPGRVGGFGASRAIHDLCRTHDIPLWCGGMLESGIGRAHNVALASLPGFTLPGDLSASRRYWDEDIVEPEFEMSDGTLHLPPGPGIGVAPREGRIRTLSVRHEVVR